MTSTDLDKLISTWRSLLAERGITPESEDALRALPPETACARVTVAINRLSGATR